MLEKENLTPFQIQLLLYYLTAEPSKRTVTDSARSLNVSKWVVTRTLDTLEKLNIVERLENRKTVLTVPGVKLAEKYHKQRKVLEKYMQYQDIPPAQIKENALRALAAGFSDEFMDRLAEQESRMHIKEIFAGRRDFHGGDICNYLSDGSYYFPFIIYREQIKNHNNLSMANRGFENPCEVIVKDHEGLVYLAAKTVSAQSMSSKNKMEGRIQKLQYLYDGEFRDGGIGGVLFHDASELPVEGFRSLVAAGYCIFRAAVFLHDFDVGQPKGGRIFHHDVALFIERKLPLGGIVGAWLDFGIRVRIGEIKRADFTVLLAVIKIIIGKNLVQFLVGQFDDLIVFFFRIHFVKPPSLRFILCKNSDRVAKRTNAVNGQDERLRRY